MLGRARSDRGGGDEIGLGFGFGLGNVQVFADRLVLDPNG